MFSDVSIPLNGKSTVIFGENGSGKTSLLSAINILSWNWIYRMCPNQGTAFRSINSDINYPRGYARGLLMTLQIGCINGDVDDMIDLKSTGDPFTGL